MMTQKYLKGALVIFAVLLMAGCKGSGNSDNVGALLGTTGTSSSHAGTTGPSDASLARVQNPEPATLLLLAGGMAAIGYMRNPKKRME
jgi:hypothetical protein